AFDRRDVEADLRATEDFLAETERGIPAAEAALAQVTAESAEYPARWAAVLDARRAKVIGCILLSAAIRSAQGFLRSGDAPAAVAMTSGPADLAALDARLTALDQAIASGPRVGRLPPAGGPGGAPGGSS